MHVILEDLNHQPSDLGSDALPLRHIFADIIMCILVHI